MKHTPVIALLLLAGCDSGYGSGYGPVNTPNYYNSPNFNGGSDLYDGYGHSGYGRHRDRDYQYNPPPPERPSQRSVPPPSGPMGGPINLPPPPSRNLPPPPRDSIVAPEPPPR